MIGGFGEFNVLYMIGSIVMMLLFFMFFPRLMLVQIMYKLKSAVNELEDTAREAEDMFLNAAADSPTPEMRESLKPMKNMVVSQPASLDPAGMFDKMEHVLDSSEDKMERYVESLAPDVSEEEKANLSMAFKGVYGSHQIFVIIRHFKNLVEETKNYQIGGMIQMMLPVYKELAESQKKATEAFLNEVPIGDTIGPLVAAKLTTEEPKEVAEDIMVSEETLEDDHDYVVMKSKGPGARLGKYGDAVEQVMADHEIEKIVTVDAGLRFEGEETGTVVDGSGVLMGGPGVEKGKIEEAAIEHDAPLEGYVIKQSGPQASQPMHRKIWDAQEDVLGRIRDEIRTTDGTVLVIGVGNTCGVGNTKESIHNLKATLRPYWAEQEEESTSYFGLMSAFPVGGGDQYQLDANNTFHLFQKLVR
ncbi:MAG: DUF1512 domain-containing protein [Candidatus Nanohaloarchaeota archaeon QJJ-5]|nr:DUF1512 domain-containing protein [Candidatus Nanohaloarchaeota archaeon QJJ-5]